MSHPYIDNLEAAHARIAALESELCDDCRKKLGLAPKEQPTKTKKCNQTTNKTESKKPKNSKKIRLMLMIAFYSTVAVALFWGIWSLFAPVPVLIKTGITAPEFFSELPFPISRWWDIPATPIVCMLLFGVISIICSPYDYSFNKKGVFLKGLTNTMLLGLTLGTFCGSFFGLIFGVGGSMVFGIVIISGSVFAGATIFPLVYTLLYGTYLLLKPVGKLIRSFLLLNKKILNT